MAYKLKDILTPLTYKDLEDYIVTGKDGISMLGYKNQKKHETKEVVTRFQTLADPSFFNDVRNNYGSSLSNMPYQAMQGVPFYILNKHNGFSLKDRDLLYKDILNLPLVGSYMDGTSNYFAEGMEMDKYKQVMGLFAKKFNTKVIDNKNTVKIVDARNGVVRSSFQKFKGGLSTVKNALSKQDLENVKVDSLVPSSSKVGIGRSKILLSNQTMGQKLTQPDRVVALVDHYSKQVIKNINKQFRKHISFANGEHLEKISYGAELLTDIFVCQAIDMGGNVNKQIDNALKLQLSNHLATLSNYSTEEIESMSKNAELATLAILNKLEIDPQKIVQTRKNMGITYKSEPKDTYSILFGQTENQNYQMEKGQINAEKEITFTAPAPVFEKYRRANLNINNSANTEYEINKIPDEDLFEDEPISNQKQQFHNPFVDGPAEEKLEEQAPVVQANEIVAPIQEAENIEAIEEKTEEVKDENPIISSKATDYYNIDSLIPEEEKTETEYSTKNYLNLDDYIEKEEEKEEEKEDLASKYLNLENKIEKEDEYSMNDFLNLEDVVVENEKKEAERKEKLAKLLAKKSAQLANVEKVTVSKLPKQEKGKDISFEDFENRIKNKNAKKAELPIQEKGQTVTMADFEKRIEDKSQANDTIEIEKMLDKNQPRKFTTKRPIKRYVKKTIQTKLNAQNQSKLDSFVNEKPEEVVEFKIIDRKSKKFTNYEMPKSTRNIYEEKSNKPNLEKNTKNKIKNEEKNQKSQLLLKEYKSDDTILPATQKQSKLLKQYESDDALLPTTKKEPKLLKQYETDNTLLPTTKQEDIYNEDVVELLPEEKATTKLLKAYKSEEKLLLVLKEKQYAILEEPKQKLGKVIVPSEDISYQQAEKAFDNIIAGVFESMYKSKIERVAKNNKFNKCCYDVLDILYAKTNTKAKVEDVQNIETINEAKNILGKLNKYKFQTLYEIFEGKTVVSKNAKNVKSALALINKEPRKNKTLMKTIVKEMVKEDLKSLKDKKEELTKNN